MSDNEPPLWSERNALRLIFRAAMMVATSPFLIAFGAYQTGFGTGEAAERGPMALGAGILFLVVGGLWMWSARSGESES